MSKARRSQPVEAATSVMRMMAKRLRKLPKPGEEPPAEEVVAKVRAFSKALGDFVKQGEKCIGVSTSSLVGAEGLKKEFLEQVRSRVFVQIAFTEIRSFFVGGNTPGTYDGMFQATAKHGQDGARAMLELFVDIVQPPNVRRLAAEGVAQLGDKSLVEAVREIHGDDLEEPDLRRKAMFVLARIGDRGPLEKEVAKIDAQLEILVGKAEEGRGLAAKLQKQYQALAANKNASDEEKKELVVVQKALSAATNQWVNLQFQVGGAHNARAVMFQEIRDHGATESCYENCLKAWLQIGSFLDNPRSRGNVNITFYNLACVQSLQSKVDAAITNMDRCFAWGYRNYDWINQDGDLDNIKNTERFKALVAEVKSGKAVDRWKTERAARVKAQQEAMKKSGGADGSSAQPDGATPDGP